MPDHPTAMTEKQRKHKAEKSRRDMCEKRNSLAPYPPRPKKKAPVPPTATWVRKQAPYPRPKKKAPVPPTAPVPPAQPGVKLALTGEIKADLLTATRKST